MATEDQAKAHKKAGAEAAPRREKAHYCGGHGSDEGAAPGGESY